MGLRDRWIDALVARAAHPEPHGGVPQLRDRKGRDALGLCLRLPGWDSAVSTTGCTLLGQNKVLVAKWNSGATYETTALSSLSTPTWHPAASCVCDS